MKTIAQGYLASSTAALIWGFFFFVAKIAVDTMPTLNVLAWRYAFALVPIAVFALYRKIRINSKALWGGMVLGVLLFAADFFQLTGIRHGTVNGSALLSQMIILFTPLFMCAMGKQIGGFDAVRAAVAFIGMVLFVTGLHLTVGSGDMYVIIFAAVLSLYFIANDWIVQRANLPSLLLVQFITQTVLAFVFSMIFTYFTIPGDTIRVWLPIVYLGIFGTALAWSLNSWAQQFVQPHKVVLVYVLEPLLAGFLGIFLLNESLNLVKFVGTMLVLMAIVAPVFRKRISFLGTNV